MSISANESKPAKRKRKVKPLNHDWSGHEILWMLFGIPAIIGWIVIGAAWLLAPRFGFPPEYLKYGLYGTGCWYGLLMIIFGGWIGLFAVASSL
jgi:hypothetical protein